MNNILRGRIFDWKSMVQYSDPVSNTKPILSVKDDNGPSKASTKGQGRHCTPYIDCIILKKIFLSKEIYKPNRGVPSHWGSYLLHV